jgi:hypothetical protein
MTIVTVERVPTHGGSLRVFVSGDPAAKQDGSALQLLALEHERGLDRLETYQAFAREVAAIRERLRNLLDGLKREGHRLAGYGAPAKGNTLLNYCAIGPDRLDYIAEKNPLKQGLWTPGTRIPVVAEERLLSDQPPYALLLAWNYLEEFLRESRYIARGGRFIVPLPDPKIVEPRAVSDTFSTVDEDARKSV